MFINNEVGEISWTYYLSMIELEPRNFHYWSHQEKSDYLNMLMGR